jgi:hypothetical protein
MIVLLENVNDGEDKKGSQIKYFFQGCWERETPKGKNKLI